MLTKKASAKIICSEEQKLNNPPPPPEKMSITHALFESASGYAIFEVKLVDGIGSKSAAAQESIKDLSKFSKMVTLASFSPFKSAADALENINDVSESEFSHRDSGFAGAFDPVRSPESGQGNHCGGATCID